MTDDDSLSRLIGDEGSLSELSCFTTAALAPRVFLTGDDSSDDVGADLFRDFPTAFLGLFFAGDLILEVFVKHH